MQASSSEFSTGLNFWKNTLSRTLSVRRWDTSVVKSSEEEEPERVRAQLRRQMSPSWFFESNVPYMTACRSTSFGLSVASKWGGTVSCQFWPSHTSSSSAAASGSRASGESTLLHIQKTVRVRQYHGSCFNLFHTDVADVSKGNLLYVCQTGEI